MISWPLTWLAAGFTAGACFLACGFRYDGELDGAVLRIVAGLGCCLIGVVAALVSEFGCH